MTRANAGAWTEESRLITEVTRNVKINLVLTSELFHPRVSVDAPQSPPARAFTDKMNFSELAVKLAGKQGRWS
jgi:hypothetical protein